MTKLQGKLALVTGVTSGIGLATARALLGREMRVLGVGRDAERLSRLESELGQRFKPILADLAEPESRQRALSELGQEPLQLLVNNAGECLFETMEQLPPARLARLFEINVTAVLDFVQAALPSLHRGSQIINVSSVVARHLPGPKFAGYAASKRALDCLSEALRLELLPRGVHVSTIAPGLVDTPIYDKVEGFEPTRKKLREQVPDWLEPEDVAEAIVWVASRPAHVVVSDLTILASAQAR